MAAAARRRLLRPAAALVADVAAAAVTAHQHGWKCRLRLWLRLQLRLCVRLLGLLSTQAPLSQHGHLPASGHAEVL